MRYMASASGSAPPRLESREARQRAMRQRHDNFRSGPHRRQRYRVVSGMLNIGQSDHLEAVLGSTSHSQIQILSFSCAQPQRRERRSNDRCGGMRSHDNFKSGPTGGTGTGWYHMGSGMLNMGQSNHLEAVIRICPYCHPVVC